MLWPCEIQGAQHMISMNNIYLSPKSKSKVQGATSTASSSCLVRCIFKVHYMKLELTAYQAMPESLTMKLIKLFRYYVTFRNKIKMFHTLKERYNEQS